MRESNQPHNNRVAADGIEILVRIQRLQAAAEHDRYVAKPAMKRNNFKLS